MNEKILNSNVLTITMEDGSKRDANILFAFEEVGDTYIFYELDNIAYAGKLGNNDELLKIEEDEMKLIENIYEEWVNQQDDDEE